METIANRRSDALGRCTSDRMSRAQNAEFGAESERDSFCIDLLQDSRELTQPFIYLTAPPGTQDSRSDRNRTGMSKNQAEGGAPEWETIGESYQFSLMGGK